MIIDLGGPGRRRARADATAPTEGRRLFKRYVRSREPQRPVPRVDPARGGARTICAASRRSRGGSRSSVLPDSAEQRHAEAVLAAAAGPHRDAADAAEPRPAPSTRRLAIPLSLPDGRTGFLERLRIEAAPTIVARDGRRRRIGCSTRCARCRRSARPTMPLNAPGAERRARRGARSRCCARCATTCCRSARRYNADTINGVLLRNSARRAARCSGCSPRGSIRPSRTSATPPSSAPTTRCAPRCSAVASLLDDEILRGAREPRRARRVRTNFYQRPERPVFRSRWRARKVEGMVSPRPLFEIYVHSRHARGHPPARRQGGARRHPLERPARRLPHRDPRPDEDADGEERGHRAGRLEGRLRAQGQLPPRPALDAYLVDRYREFVSGLLDVTDNIVARRGRASARRRAPRRRRSVPGGRGRQGHGAPLGHRQPGLGAVRLLARRRVRVGRQQRLRPQEGRHHGARRVGVRAAPLPRAGRRRRRREPFTVAGIGDMCGDVFGNGVLRSRDDAARRRVQPPAHLPRPAIRTRSESFAERERLFDLPRSTWRDYDASIDQRGRRRLRSRRQGDPARARGARAARPRQAERRAARR